MQGKPMAEQEIGKQLLQETAAYAESSVCRRKTLLHYFGETYNSDNCGNCDNCLHPRKKVDATEQLLSVIETIATLKEKFRSEYVVSVLLGKLNPEIKSYHHDKIEEFGCEQHSDSKFLNAVINQAIIAGFIERDVENYGLLKLTEAGRQFPKSHSKFYIVEDRDFSEVDDSELSDESAYTIDPELLGILKDLRKKVAAKNDLPPYVIFQMPSLEAMATNYPISLDELKMIPGVGEGKARRYGTEFVKVIKKHVEENDIERPMDLRIKTVPNKSKIKIELIQGIDRRIDLVELAKSKGLEFEGLLDELEAIVYSGTKININYYIDEVMDEDHRDEIFDYFAESETDRISVALEELGPDFTTEEVRLVRIQFLSEMGN